MKTHTISRKRSGVGIHLGTAAILIALLLCSSATQAAVWTGTTGNWSSTGNPGWGGIEPNGIGAIASKTDGTTATVTQDIGAGVTVGTITFGGVDKSFTITPTNALTLNQDGAGSGFATISNTGSGTGAYRVAVGTGTVTLADDLLVSNTSATTNASGAISITSTIGGSGNVTISNVSNNVAAGQIVFSPNNSSAFTGGILIQKGAVTFSNANFGSSANVITLGSSGSGSASLVSTSTGNTFTNNITVASGSGGTLILGSTDTNSAANKNTVFSGTVLLNGNVTLTSAKAGANAVVFSNVISGAGGVTIGGGTLSNTLTRFSGVNTYTGNTVISEGTFNLASTGAMRFVIGANGVNNSVSGTGTALFDGTFNFDLSGAATTPGSSWTIVNLGTLNGLSSFSGTFAVSGFTESANVWTNGIYSFSETTGILSIAAIPEPSACALFAGAGLLLFAGIRRKIGASRVN